MSPDLQVRRRVRQQLDQRPYLIEQEWIEQYCQPEGIAVPIALFAYTHLQQYSGLEIGRVRLTDRLEADLHWSQICWFDWMFTLSQDFWQSFAIDIEELLHDSDFDTVGDLLSFLSGRWTAHIADTENTEQSEQGRIEKFPTQEV